MTKNHWRYRVNWRGKLVLQVLERGRELCPFTKSVEDYARWRDAKVTDIDLPFYIKVMA